MEKIEKMILSYLKESDKPQGAGSLCSFLKGEGIVLGQATVGRLIRKMEEEGLLEKTTAKGRRLSQKGEEHLQNLILLDEKKASLRYFGQFFLAEDGTYLRDILVARRALESEAAALAAENATEEDLRNIEKSLEEMELLLSKKKSMAVTDVAFHLAITKASKNKIIESAMKVIRHGGQDSPLVENIRNKAGSIIGYDHKEIYLAIKNKDKEKARNLMKEHLDNIIKDLDYIEQKEGLNSFFNGKAFKNTAN